jgi:hypothetical protein
LFGSLVILLTSGLLLSACSTNGGTLHVQQLTEEAQKYAGQEITVDGAYLWRPGNPDLSVLAIGVSTLTNGLDAQPLGDSLIWLEEFPPEVTNDLHQPGDAVYGLVRVTGQFETGGGYGPEGAYAYRIRVSQAKPIEQVQYVEHKISDGSLGEGKVSFFELQREPEQYDGQTVTTQGYYFWNSIIWVLAEGVATEEGGGNPQPMGEPIWMEGFPPEESSRLNLGPNNSYIWGEVEVTGTFQTGGSYGKDGAYQHIFFVESARVLEPQSE